MFLAIVAERPLKCAKRRTLAHFMASGHTYLTKRRPFKRVKNERALVSNYVCNSAQSALFHTFCNPVNGPPESVIFVKTRTFWPQKGAKLAPFGTLLAPINYTPGGRPLDRVAEGVE